MTRPRRKRIGALILWVIAFIFVVVDQSERLQSIIDLVPSQYAVYLPAVYGTLGLIALLLLNSAHEDDLEELRQAVTAVRPRLALGWLNADTPANAGGPPLLIHNDGDAAAYAVSATIPISDQYLIRIAVAERIPPNSHLGIAPILDFDGPTRPARGGEDVIAFVRKARRWDSEAGRELKKHFDQARDFRRLTSSTDPFAPPPPDIDVQFDVTYSDFNGQSYSTPHALSYVDGKSAIRIELRHARPGDEAQPNSDD